MMKMKKKNNKKISKNEKMQKFCPTCGSTSVQVSRLTADNVLADFKMHECNECFWRGQPMEGTETFIQAYLEDVRKKKGKEKEIQELEEKEAEEGEVEEESEEEESEDDEE